MKTLRSYCLASVVGLSLFFSASQSARANISVSVTDSFGNVTIDPASGSIDFTTALQTSAFAQAGANAQYSSLTPSVANATDAPAPGGLATGAGAATLSPLSGSSSATGFIPGAIPGFDTSTGQASAYGVFEITGATGPVKVTFTTAISGELNLSADAYGVYGQGESIFSLSIDGTPELFTDTQLSVGPNQTQDLIFSQSLTNTMTLMANTPYWIYDQADSEALVLNSSTPVPDSVAGPMMAGCLALSVLLLHCLRRRWGGKPANRLFLVLLAGATLPVRATYIGCDAPDICLTCGAPSTRLTAGAVSTSISEGNTREDYFVVKVRSAYGPTLPFALTYNSYNADGSRAQLDTGLGFGWSHTYNVLLFQQRGQMFRLGADGRVTQYFMNFSGTGGTYTSDTGYFETLTLQSDGTFYVTNKYQSWWQFGLVANTPFLVTGPVYRLLQMGDPNQNITTMTYNSSGLLTTATDPFGRTLQFTYNSSNKLSSVTDPLGRTTTFQYDALNRMPIMITDPLGNSVQYTYNSEYQMTRKIDRDGRMYFYTYKSLLPFMVTDGSGQPYFSMANPTNWAVNRTNLAFTLRRQYVPSTTTETDGNGNLWQYSYDTNGYITLITAPDATTTSYTYDPGTREIASMTDANGKTTRYQYDAEGNRISMTDALGNVTTYTYDPVFNLITSMTDPNDRTTTYTYDTHGNRLQTIDALGQTQSWTYDTHGNVLSATNKRGYTTQYTYDANGNLLQTIDPLTDTTTYSYDAIGNLLRVTDANGHTTTYTYDRDDHLIQTTDPLGNITSSTYDGVGDVLSTTDANAHTTFYDFDLRARLVFTTNALAAISHATYDTDNNLITRTDQDGHTTTYSYDKRNRLLAITDPLSDTSSMTYDAVGNAISTTDANGNTTTYDYDALNRRTSMTDPLGDITTYEYANTGGLPCCGATAGYDLITGIIDADGKITYYQYDELNRRYQKIQKSGGTNDVVTPSDAVTTTTYDPEDNAIAVTDPNANTTTMTYDAINRVIGMTNAAGDVSTTAYDPVGNIVQTVDPRGNVTASVYDADNRRIQETDSIGPVIRTEYDPVGNVIATTNGNGNVTGTAYDALNRRITVTDPLGHTTTTIYDPVGNVLETTDRNGNSTTYTYDADNREITVTDPLSETTTTAYDRVGNVISITDPLTHTTQNFYDADNRVIQETYSDMPSDTRTWAYDGTGHVISRLDQNGQTTTYQYNDFYYLTNREYSVGPTDKFTYDLGGRMITGTRNGWTDDFTYDGANRVLTADQNGQSVTYSYVIPSGIRTLTYPSGTVVTELYDLRSRLVDVNDGGSPAITQYTYDLDDNVLTRTNRNGTLTSDSYNANDWVTTLTHTNTSSLIAGFAYAYDNEGNKAYQSNQTVMADSEAYQYDTLYRLTAYDVGVLSGGVIPSPRTAESYTLDAVGNWTTYDSNSVTQSRTHNAVNEILTIDGNPLTYDGNGNLINDGRYAYTYNVENLVTTITRDSDSALVGQYAYDALGRRITSLTDPAGTPATNVFLYDDTRILEDQDSGGTTQATYTFGNYVDEVLTMDRAGKTYYYHPNALFDVEAVTDSSGAAVERYMYDAYGEPAVLDGAYNPVPFNSWGTPHSAISNEYLFTGRQLDEEAGLYFYRARYYDCAKGRFLERDPLGYAQGMNLYEYVNSRPEFATDPTGLGTETNVLPPVPLSTFDTVIGGSSGPMAPRSPPSPSPSLMYMESYFWEADPCKPGNRIFVGRWILVPKELYERSLALARRARSIVQSIERSYDPPNNFEFVTPILNEPPPTPEERRRRDELREKEKELNREKLKKLLDEVDKELGEVNRALEDLAKQQQSTAPLKK
jgi:RHS repeat-associated protein